MSTTDQRPADAALRAASRAPEDPLIVEQMVAPVARRAVEIIRDMRPTNALSRLVTPEIAQVLSRRAALTRRLRASTGYAPPRQLQVTGVRT